MRNAGSEIESVRNNQAPASVAPVRIANAITHARIATLRLPDGGSPLVTPRNAGVSPIGSTTTSSVTSAEITNSSGNAIG